MGLADEVRAVMDGGITVQALSLTTLRGTTTVSHATSLWAPNGAGRIVFEHGSIPVPFEDNLVDVLVRLIAKTDWARRAWRSPGLDVEY